MSTNLTLSAAGDRVWRAASRLADTRRGPVSGAHVFAVLLRDPFPTLASALGKAGLKPSGLAEIVEDQLADAELGLDGVAPLSTVIAGLAAAEADAGGPEILLRAAIEQGDPVVSTLLRHIEREQPGVGEKLAALSASEPTVPPVPAGPLGSEHIGARVAAVLAKAAALSEGRQVSTRTMLRVWVSDTTSLIAKALFANALYEPVLHALGGKARPVVAKRTAPPLTRCTEYLRSTLERARQLAATLGEDRVGERSLALAVLRQAREDVSSDLAVVGGQLRDLEWWIEQATTEQVEGAGEVALEQIVPFLRARVINQEPAIREVYRPVLRVRLGLGFKDALAAVLLFVGPPGVGKSHLAKLMAQVLYGHDPENPEAHVVMVECGRYKDSHAVTDLIGAPHGYMGSDKGILRDGVRDKYPCVIIFDEAERMNRSMWDALLTMFNDGVFRDNLGARYTLTDCVVVLTSNAGIETAENYRRKKLIGDHGAADALAAEAHRALGGPARAAAAGPRETLSDDEFWSHDEYRENYKSILLNAAREHFGPALYSRVDEKIGFNGLRQEDYVYIARNALDHLVSHLLLATGVRLWYSADVPTALAAQVVRQYMDGSAREMNRMVRKYVLDDAFAPLKLKEFDGLHLEPAYEIKASMRGRAPNQHLDRVELVPAPPPEQ